MTSFTFMVYFRHGDLSVERFLKVYDLRVMKSVSPIPMMFPPLLLRFIPAYSSRLCVVSQVIAFFSMSSTYIHTVECSFLTTKKSLLKFY